MQKLLCEYLLVFHSRSRLPAFQTRKLGLFYLLCVKVRPLDNVSVEVEGVTSEMVLEIRIIKLEMLLCNQLNN